MTADDVHAVVDAASRAGLNLWVDGGWGVDALLGTINRDHDDLDVVAELDAIDSLLASVTPLGYTVAEDHLPIRLVLRAADGRQVDVHPVTFDVDGTGWQAAAGPDGSDCPYPQDGFTIGQIDGREVNCLHGRAPSRAPRWL